MTTVPRRGWAGVKNGDLLALAEKEFDVFVTVDKKLGEQQDLWRFDLAVVLMRSRSNKLEELRKLTPELLGALSQTTPRRLAVVGN